MGLLSEALTGDDRVECSRIGAPAASGAVAAPWLQNSKGPKASKDIKSIYKKPACETEIAAEWHALGSWTARAPELTGKQQHA